MVHPCLVVCGKWKCDVDGEWEFLLDKGRLPRNVLVPETVKTSELCNILVAEFGDLEIMAKDVKLSYFVPSLADSCNERQTPPIFMATDVSLASFMQRFSEERGTNLFVTFIDNQSSEELNMRSAVDDVEPYVPECIIPDHGSMDVQVSAEIYANNDGHSGVEDLVYRTTTTQLGPHSHINFTQTSDPFTTPVMTRMRNVVDPYVPEALVSQPTFDLNEGHSVDDVLVHRGTTPQLGTVSYRNDSPMSDSFRTPVMTRNNNVSEPYFDLNEVCIDEEDMDVHFLLKEVEAIEEEIRSSEKSKGKRPCLNDLVEVESVEPIEEDIRNSEKRQGKRPCLNDVVEVESDGEEDVEDFDVRSRGYDKEFWQPFLEEEFGGSNAVEVMSSLDDDFELRVPPEVHVNNENLGRGDGAGDIGATSQTGVNSQQAEGHDEPHRIERQDEVFDIPPLFDDTTYDFADIPDLDNEDEEIHVGKTFASKSDCQIALAIYAIKKMFYFKQTRTTKEFFVATCADSKCDWRVSAHKVSDSCYYKIKKASLGHSCGIDTRSMYNKKATYKVIASVCAPQINNNEAKPKAKDLQQLAREELRVSATYTKCWRAMERGKQDSRGSDEESFAKLSEYLYALKLANPGTIADIETVTDLASGMERFLYVFLAFGASIIGFRHVRRVIVIDGTHLHGKYKGVLLTASGQDANFQVFPLAFAVVDSEDDNAWTWFLTKVKDNIIADSPTLTIISDRHNSIYAAKKSVFPLARHGACVVHLARNVSGHFKSKGIGKLVVRAACAYRIKDFDETYKEIEKRSSGCAKYLHEIGRGHWARAYFQGNRYNMMTSNIAESLNNAMKNGRNAPITELLMFIQTMMSRWFSERRKKAGMHRNFITPEVDKLMTKNLGYAKGCKLYSLSTWNYEVHGRFGGKYKLDLRDKRCTCKRWDLLQIPCGHALLAADHKRLSYERLAGNWYRTSVWVQTYGGIIQPPDDVREIEIPEDVRTRVLLPPKTRRPPGRPRGKRLSSFGEISGPKTMRKCGRCKGVGHNRTSCKHPI